MSDISARRHAPSSSNHSHSSSLTEETSNGYVPMAPVDDGYVDMDSVQPGQRYHGEGEMTAHLVSLHGCHFPDTDRTHIHLYYMVLHGGSL